MEKTLADQLQDVLKALAVAEEQAATVQATMRKSHIFLGLEYGYIEDDIAHVANKVRYMNLLAEHHSEASRN